jgi:hypothetical protein
VNVDGNTARVAGSNRIPTECRVVSPHNRYLVMVVATSGKDSANGVLSEPVNSMRVGLPEATNHDRFGGYSLAGPEPRDPSAEA